MEAASVTLVSRGPSPSASLGPMPPQALAFGLQVLHVPFPGGPGGAAAQLEGPLAGAEP